MLPTRSLRALLVASTVTLALVACQLHSSATVPAGAHGQGYQGQPMHDSGQGRTVSARELFATTVGAVLQGSVSAATLGLAQFVNGRISDWFGAPTAADPALYDQAAYDGYVHESAPAYTDPYAHAGGQPGAYPTPQANRYPDQYDPYTADPAAAPHAAEAVLHAGLAYEVHAARHDGSAIAVDPRMHEFRTGDRFELLFRASLPGRLDIININPAGVETHVDTTLVAAGELSRLGPFEFTALRGDEALRLVLWPCSDHSLTATTRDIVRVAGTAGNAYEHHGLGFVACEALRTRAVRSVATRDIRLIAHDAQTSFALDPVFQSELASGQLQPRELTIVFRHR